MKVLISGGGTGGHIYPAIAIANKIKQEIKGVDIRFVGTNEGLEKKLVPEAGYRLETITVSGFKRKLCMDTIKSVKNLCVGIKDAVKIIHSFKPDLVIGTGGYVCGPVVFIASLLNIKTVIHEQNVIPGMTNKILSNFVKKILVSFEESKPYFKNSNKIVVTGNPVRKAFNNISKEKCRKKLNIPENKFVVMSFGGSRGAEKINSTMAEVLKKVNGHKQIYMIHVTGSKHYKSFMKKIGKNIKLRSNILIKEYIYDMSKYMGASDLVICRAGAITLAEITAMGLPSVLIPSPYVANNHQEYNAKVLEKNGAAKLLNEKDMIDENVLKLLYDLVKNPSKLDRMAKHSKTLAKPNATDKIYTNILNLIKS